MANRLFNWQRFTPSVAEVVIDAVPESDLRALLTIVREDLGGRHSGFPDLTVVYGPGRYEFRRGQGAGRSVADSPAAVDRGPGAAGPSGSGSEVPMRVGVKELAEFVHRKGDLHYRYESSTLAQEGIARQKDYQKDRGGSYRREVKVDACFGDLEVSGRIDGWDPEVRLVEEIKTTRVDPRELHAHAGDLNLAQLRLYGAMLVLADETLDDLSLRLVYLHPAKPDETAFEETARRDELIGYFETTCAIFAAWVTTVGERVAARDRQLAALNFPYGNFRTDQRRIAKHLFRAFRDGEHWLVEAPTGSGKTMAGLFAALKAMGTGALDRLAFLTSRTTGQQAVEEALADVVEVLGWGTCALGGHGHRQGPHLLQSGRAVRSRELRIRQGLLRPHASRPSTPVARWPRAPCPDRGGGARAPSLSV